MKLCQINRLLALTFKMAVDRQRKIYQALYPLEHKSPQFSLSDPRD